MLLNQLTFGIALVVCLVECMPQAGGKKRIQQHQLMRKAEKHHYDGQYHHEHDHKHHRPDHHDFSKHVEHHEIDEHHHDDHHEFEFEHHEFDKHHHPHHHERPKKPHHVSHKEHHYHHELRMKPHHEHHKEHDHEDYPDFEHHHHDEEHLKPHREHQEDHHHKEVELEHLLLENFGEKLVKKEKPHTHSYLNKRDTTVQEFSSIPSSPSQVQIRSQLRGPPPFYSDTLEVPRLGERRTTRQSQQYPLPSFPVDSSVESADVTESEEEDPSEEGIFGHSGPHHGPPPFYSESKLRSAESLRKEIGTPAVRTKREYIRKSFVPEKYKKDEPKKHLLGEDGHGIQKSTTQLAHKPVPVEPKKHLLGEDGHGIQKPTTDRPHKPVPVEPKKHLLGEDGHGIQKPTTHRPQKPVPVEPTKHLLGEDGHSIQKPTTDRPHKPVPVVSKKHLLGEDGHGIQKPTTDRPHKPVPVVSKKHLLEEDRQNIQKRLLQSASGDLDEFIPPRF